MDLSEEFESLNLFETKFMVTLSGIHKHIPPERIRILDRIARFYGHTTTGENLIPSSEVGISRCVR